MTDEVFGLDELENASKRKLKETFSKVFSRPKEELWKEAVTRVDAFIDNFSQDVRSTLYDRLSQEDVKDFLYGLYVDSAEPREKQIEELTEQNTSLLTSVENLNKSVQELEAQIEKMKCCENCAWWYKLPNGQRDCAETCENLDNWSLRR